MNFSIRQKITLLLMGVSTVAVIVASLAFYFLIVDRYQQSYLDDLHSLADMTGTNCSVSLAFGIPEDAEQLLASLSKRPSIVSASIHDMSGKVFASYNNTGASPHTITPAGYSSPPDKNDSTTNLRISHEIEMNGSKIGEIRLLDNMRPIRVFKRIAMVILNVIVFVVLGFTSIIASRLRELVSTPISNLAKVAQEITTNQDFSLRAVRESSDEVGNLVDTFNNMLAQIAQRNEALEKSEYRFRSFINQAVDAFLLHDMEGRLVDVNRRACDSLGYSREELLTMTVADIDINADNGLYNQNFWTRLQPESPITVEGRHRRKDGETYPVEVRIGLLELGGEKLIMALARDISERLEAEEERRRLETQLQQAQKMESIGTLAGGIAHDFNNILTPIFGYLEIAMLKTAKDPAVTKNLRNVRQAAERAKEMVDQILTFSRRDAENVSPIQVHVIVKEALKLLRASIPTTIDIRQSIDPHCGSVLATPTQIHQIIMNLCTNAFHAMRETGGVLGVSLAPVEISANEFSQKLHLAPGPYLQLEVSDTGHGIEAAARQRIFEPYFTTKAKGEGTGMGLAVVHGIVKSIGGHITVYSEPGQGASFHIYLPVIAAALASDNDSFQGPAPTGTEKIMLIDDEEEVRNVEKEMLEDLGYEVTTFAGPYEAIDHFTAHAEMYDLVITDMTMPHMTGDKLARKIMELHPGMPVILCTGFSDLINETTAKAMGIKAFVTKPIIRQSFARTVRNVLD